MRSMDIARLHYPVATLGPGQRLGLWMLGCERACPGCSNPELWARDAGRARPVTELLRLIRALAPPGTGLTITGGEPFAQPEALLALISGLQPEYIDILVYTGYRLAELLAMNNPTIDAILRAIAALIDGPYIAALNDGGALRGSANQHILIFRQEMLPDYWAAAARPRTVQNLLVGHQAYSIGLPQPGERARLPAALAARGLQHIENAPVLTNGGTSDV